MSELLTSDDLDGLLMETTGPNQDLKAVFDHLHDREHEHSTKGMIGCPLNLEAVLVRRATNDHGYGIFVRVGGEVIPLTRVNPENKLMKTLQLQDCG